MRAPEERKLRALLENTQKAGPCKFLRINEMYFEGEFFLAICLLRFLAIII